MTGSIKFVRRIDPKTGDWAETPVYFIDGKKVTRRAFMKAFPPKDGVPMCGNRPGWPVRSRAMAVHTKQVAAANARNKAAGVNVQYDPKTGEAVIPDNAARKRLMKLEGYRDLSGYD